ncbi:lipocalin family protein [Siphonobacter aquaeclarae]|jgi:hypothetical protein|uniref:Lipocalin-like domain-containing protein n=1 Tax=Siphonobacter aquaeclarae TaxID=563176 RepID=A0A1G9KV15_9BACT|nr:lipocalin family protein [Siphonobacter aquaeclarae]SDL53337.1 Lipocalin-like domain-containing protein [Siphonobacter aquaeclarae]
MNKTALLFLSGLFLTACQSHSGLQGTWQLVSAKTNENGKETLDTHEGKKMLKMLNDTHFSFLDHDLKGGKDSTSAAFTAGGGSYTLEGDQYTEHLDYCSYRPWEGKSFTFTVRIQNDTLIQTGKEQIKELGIDRIITETYVRVK